MTTTTAGPLFTDNERTILHTEGARKGWQIDLRVHYTEHEIARIMGGASVTAPEWNVDVTALRDSARMTASIYESDPDRVRILARRFIEGLPDER